MLLYAITIFLSAFLLFQVQPIIAKIILPWFGGAAAVWSACMLFFQFVLLLGYLYAHFLVRYFRPKVQVIVHVSLLALTLALLHILPSQAWKPTGGEDPVLKIVGLLAASVGLPYLALSTTGPLMQAWYARSHNIAFPYRLFAVSNLGSLLALLTYPPLVEPYIATSHQALMWSLSYGAFCLLCAGCAWQARGDSPVQPEAASSETQEPEGPPSWRMYLYWGALTACSSTLLLAVTNFMSQNVASVPFLWILPLGLYLVSFILTFERESWYRRNIYIAPLALALGGMCYGIAKFDGGTDLRYVIPTFAGALLACCMFCHGEAARTKPHSRYLTGFYLTISIGGAIGGLFVGGLAPRFFKGFFELPVALVFCALLGVIAYWRLPKPIWAGWAMLSVALAVVLWIQERDVVKDSRFMARNFYGVLRVTQTGDLKDPDVYRVLVNGTITHGLQLLAPEKRRWATTYYGPDSGVGLAINNTRRSAQRVGVIGLGAGTLAAYGRPGDYFRFYDINPLVPEVARREFTFLMDCPAKVDIAMGDARLSLEKESSQQFDVLAVDAFSSDSIPIHLLTLEAFRLYFRHLRPGGILAVHVSNTHLRLEPVVERLAAALNKSSIFVDTEDGAGEVYGASWVLLTDQPELFSLRAFQRAGIPLISQKGLRTWTDDYSNLFQILK